MEPANRELTDEQRLFLALGPEKGWSNARTIQEFSTVFPDRQPPGRGAVAKIHQKLLREKTVQDCKKEDLATHLQSAPLQFLVGGEYFRY